jgi:cytochrome c oxidase subunit 4
MIKDHVVPLSTYLAVFTGLVVLTCLTYEAAYWDLGSHSLNVLLALAIAVTKATLVVLFFMHVKYGRRLVWVFVSVGFLWLGLLIVGTLHDYVSRGWLGR